MFTPQLPFEVWLKFLDLASLMDTKVPIVLSEASRELRDLSRLHRGRPAKLANEKRLRGFEKHLSGAGEDTRNITSLLVALPPLMQTAYADEDYEADDPRDSSYTPSSSHSDYEVDEETVSSDDGSQASSSGGEAEVEHAELSPEEILELRREDVDRACLLAKAKILPSFQTNTLLLGPPLLWESFRPIHLPFHTSVHPPSHRSDVGG